MDYFVTKRQRAILDQVHALYMHSFAPSDEDRTSDFESGGKNKVTTQVEHRKQNCSTKALLLDDRCI
jgi:hypothetical protein